jgi:hypothetical protein
MVASLMAIPLAAGAATNACPSTIPSAGFTDIGSLDQETQDAIDCIAFHDITKGTSATTYSPNDDVNRWQMALFLTRKLTTAGVTLPSGASQGFTDIGTLDAATQTAINQLAQLDITKGTTATTFDPTGIVNRWQMALFITRQLTAAGVTLPSGASQGFTDIGTLDAETQTAINQLAQLDITKGTTATTYDPTGNVNRWQMALFLSRDLETLGVVPLTLQVTVTPVANATQNAGTSRTFIATFKNADGSAYTANVGIELLDTTSADAPIYNDKADNVTFSATTDALPGVGTAELNGFPGTNGQVTFTITDTTAEQVVVVAWEDTNANSGYSSGNTAPSEPFALSGVTDFVTVAAGEASSGAFGAVVVSKTTKASDVFEAPAAGAKSYFYDANDSFTVGGAAATLQDFEDALSVGDSVSGTYAADPVDQSTFALTDTVATLTVTDPSAAKTVDANTYTIKGAADPGATVKIKVDLNDDGDALDAGEGTVASGTATPDGAYSVQVSLTQDADNDYVAHQTPSGGVEGAAVHVPTITEGANVAAKMSTSAATNGGAAGTLDPGDAIVITFNEKVAGVGTGDTLSIIDFDGSSATLTCGPDVTCVLAGGDLVLTLTIVTVVFASGGTTGGIQPSAQFTAVSGFLGDDGLAINVTGSGSGRVFGDGSPALDVF